MVEKLYLQDVEKAERFYLHNQRDVAQTSLVIYEEPFGEIS